MRAVVAFLLAAILSICPLLCRVAESGCCAGRCEEDGRGTSRPPASCPDDGVNCISAGAIQADEVSAPSPDRVGHPQSFDASTTFGSLLLTSQSPPPTAGARLDHSPGRGDGARLRALLQNFRC